MPVAACPKGSPTAREQERFGELFARWLADLEPDLRGSGEETDAPPKLPRLRGWLSGLVLLFVVLVGASYWSHIQPPPSPDRPVPSSPSRNGQTVPLPKETAGLKLRPIPPRTPLEGPTLYPVHRARLETLGDLLLILPGLLALVWLLVRWLTWRVVLARRRGDPDDPLTTVGLDARADDLLAAPDLRQTLICRGPVRPALATARFRPAQGAVAPLSGGGPSAGP